MHRHILILSMLLLLPLSSPGQENYWNSSLFIENDLFAKTDSNYTSGVRWSWISPDVDEFLEVQSNSYPWLARLNQGLEFLHPQQNNDAALRNFSVSLGQQMFTPRDKFRTSLDSDDRPYAGWLYIALGYQARTEQTLNIIEANLGNF